MLLKPPAIQPAGSVKAKNTPGKPRLSAAQTAGEQGRFDQLEAYRGFAALGIVIFHAYQHSRVGQTYIFENTPVHFILRNLDVGVSWFFVLSGFLIFLPFARAALTGQKQGAIRGFLIRRAIRILPLYYIAILLVWSARHTSGSEQWFDLFRHLTFTQIFDSQHIFWTIGPAWSLAVEMIFYLLVALTAPLIHKLCSWLPGVLMRATLITVLLSAVLTVSLGYKWWMFYIAQTPEEDYAVYYGFLAKMDLFALGMLLAVVTVVAGQGFRLGPVVTLLLRLAGFGLMASVFLLREQLTFTGIYFHSLCGLAFLLILTSSVMSPATTFWNKLLSAPAFQFLGLVSYSLYLWHEPILIDLSDRHWLVFDQNPELFLVSSLIFLLIAVGAAALSYWCLEYPATFLRHFFTREGSMVQRYPDQH